MLNLYLENYDRLLSSLLKITRQTLELIEQEQFDKLESSLNNRQRLIHQLGYYSEKIHSLFKSEETSKSIITAFSNNTDSKTFLIRAMDDKILEHLSKEMKKTDLELATVGNRKQKFKGYNLNDLKR